MGNHWGLQPQVEDFNPRVVKVACRGKDTRSERLPVEKHMWGSLRGGRHLANTQAIDTGANIRSAGGTQGSPEEILHASSP